MTPSLQKFGDSTWTQDKLERVRKYLVAYSKILSKRNFPYAYIDGFAGTGYHELEREENEPQPLLPELEEPAVTQYLDGSARIALKVEPRFNKYIFIEKSGLKAKELAKLREEFPDRAADILIKKEDANTCLQKLCLDYSWKNHRAVLFIDPFGMQLSWETLAAIGQTQAIDTWILFPVSAVNRLLKKDSDIRPSWRRRLDTMFGDSGWFDAFFPEDKPGLFGNELAIRRKIAGMDMIGKYFNERLRTVFADVAPNPYTLCNSKGVPLFLLCFAVANPNPKAVKLSLKIAQDILKRESKTPELPFKE
jgi:three-Cys-motif partner protein